MELLATGGVLAGLLVGFLAGMAVQSARHAVNAHRTAKAGLPDQKKTASGAETRGAAWLLGIAAYVLFMLLVMARID